MRWLLQVCEIVFQLGLQIDFCSVERTERFKNATEVANSAGGGESFRL